MGSIPILRAVACWACLCSCALLSAHAQSLIVAHRGASADAPENTLPSFELAWQQDADAVEGDFYLTRDQKIICIHDDTTERVAAVNLPVARSTLKELRALDVGRWKSSRFAGVRMPTLNEVLGSVPEEKLVFLEIKCGPEIVPFLQRELKESPLPTERTRIISFKAEVIEAAKLVMPDRDAYWLVKFRQDEKTGRWEPSKKEIIETAQRIGADGLDVLGEPEVVDSEFVTHCHRLGLSVHVWTIDDPEKARYFQQLDVDSITTNRPRELRRALTANPIVPVQTQASEPAAVAPAAGGP